MEEDEEDEEEEEEEVKFIPDSSGGFVAVFCPLKLFLHTGQVSCWRKRVMKEKRCHCGCFHTVSECTWGIFKWEEH